MNMSDSSDQLSVQQLGVGWHGKWADIPALPEVGSSPYAKQLQAGQDQPLLPPGGQACTVHMS